MSRASAAHPTLRELARLCGVEPFYVDAAGRRRAASREALLRVLRALGVPAGNDCEVRAAVEQRRNPPPGPRIEPVAVAWEGRWPRSALAAVAGGAGPPRCELRLESGKVRRWHLRPGGSGGPGRLPLGYHRLAFEAGGETRRVLVISAPRRAYAPPRGGGRGGWGVFLPLYALHTRRSWGSGDLTDLRALAEWVTGLGGEAVATLPLLASFLDEPFEPSPYAPASRLFWNEFYLDPERAPEWKRCPGARALADSPEFRERLDLLRRSALVDYRGGMALKRRVLELLASSFFSAAPPSRREAFDRFLGRRPGARDYARFRAAVERRGPWTGWPARMREGELLPGDFDERAADYHLYVQFLAHEQFAALSREGGRRRAGLALDLPLGVHPCGYDPWRHRGSFAEGVSAGAPPDPFFRRGQNWGLRPLHPERIRERGHDYLIAVLRHHLARASVLRIDHVMALHRLFWIPDGMAPSEGVYVRYRAEELYAILCLESHRHRTLLVGEDLGTVPPGVRAAMAHHSIHGMRVLQFIASPRSRAPLPPVPAGSQASINTHDMPTFASFWRRLDIPERVRMGLLRPGEARAEAFRRQAVENALVHFLERRGRFRAHPSDPGAVLRACLAHLAASPARLLMVGLEDLWLETRPQNVPGTGPELPNWRRRARHSLEEFTNMREVAETLREMNKLRKGGKGRE